MIDWEQRSITVRAVRRMADVLDNTVNGRNVPEATADERFKRLYHQLVDLVQSLELSR